MASPVKFTIGAKYKQNAMESTATPTQVTTHIQNITDTDILKIEKGEMLEIKLMMMEIVLLLHPIIQFLVV